MSPKGSTLLLAASLTANAALVAVVAVRAPYVLGIGGFRLEQPAGPAAAPVAARKEGGSADGGIWSALSSADPKALVARLRAAGFPPRVVRAIVRLQLDDYFQGRRRAVAAQMPAAPYWSGRFGNWDQKTVKEVMAIGKDEDRMLRDVLGPEPDPTDPFGEMNRRLREGDISPEKYDRLQAITRDYQELTGEVYMLSKGGVLPEDREKLLFLEKEKEADLAAAVSPSELFEYQLRNGETAAQLRNKLRAFNPSEDEFRALFKAQQAFDQQYNVYVGGAPPEVFKERAAHEADLTAQAQQILDPDRFAEYQKETDPQYVALSSMVDQFDLPSASTGQLFAVQSDIIKRTAAIRGDPSLSAADRSSQLAALGDEIASKAGAILGPRGFEAYKRQYNWIFQGLKPSGN